MNSNNEINWERRISNIVSFLAVLFLLFNLTYIYNPYCLRGMLSEVSYFLCLLGIIFFIFLLKIFNSKSKIISINFIVMMIGLSIGFGGSWLMFNHFKTIINKNTEHERQMGYMIKYAASSSAIYHMKNNATDVLNKIKELEKLPSTPKTKELISKWKKEFLSSYDNQIGTLKESVENLRKNKIPWISHDQQLLTETDEIVNKLREIL